MALDRRSFLGVGGATLGASVIAPGLGARRASARTKTPHMGAVDATGFGLVPGASHDQGETLRQAIEDATRRGTPLFIPPGRYLVSDIPLPDGAYISGIPGATQLLFAGGEHMIHARGARNITLSGLTFAGAGNSFTAGTPGLVYLRDVARLAIDGCTVANSRRSGIVLEYCGGHIADCDVHGCGDTGIFSLDAQGLEIAGNHVHDCDNNGIQVWRAAKGEDGTIVSQNRVERIAARDGGNGPNGNGIAIFRAGSVMVANNRVTDCAFSAVRCNSGSNVQILGNSCERLGEVAIYAEFGFQGAVISNNLVDTAAMGISITNFDHGGRLAVCNGNIIRNIHIEDGAAEIVSSGTGISVEVDTIVGNNVVENAANIGIALGWGYALRDVSATGNVVRDAGIGMAVSVAPGAGNALVADNLISKTPKGAILGLKWSKVATGDLSQSGAEGYPQLRIERNYVS